MKRLITVLFLLILSSGLQAEITPDQLVRRAADQIAVLAKPGSGNQAGPQRLYALIDFAEEVLPHIDFRGMARLALGRYWRDATPKQRARFAREFRNQLIRIYSTALPGSTEREIIYLPFFAKPGDRTAVVKTEIKQSNGAANIPVNYNFYRKGSMWKLYDISVDGVSLVTNYRATYAEAIQKEGLDALIASIAQSNRKPTSNKKEAKGATAK